MDSDAEAWPVSLAELCVKKQTEEWRRFHSRLGQDFPHTFHLDKEHRQMEKTHLAKLRKCLESALAVGYKTALETARANNYLAFLLSCDGRWREGLAVTEKALREDGEQHNLVSLANTAVILWNMGRYSDTQKQLDMLEELKAHHTHFDYLKVKAKAELAFTYTRMGPSFSNKAIALFEEVLVEARAPEKWLWTFGLGLTRRRSLHSVQDASGESTKALDAFLSVIKAADSRNLQAKAYVEIAMLIGRMVWSKKEKERLAQRAGMWPNVACEKALELDDTDNSVLCKAARILRKDKYIDNFKHLHFTGPADLLQKALDIRPSSTAFHHLGLKYKAQARAQYMTGRVNSDGGREQENAGEARGAGGQQAALTGAEFAGSYSLFTQELLPQAVHILQQVSDYLHILVLFYFMSLGEINRQGTLRHNTPSKKTQRRLNNPEVFKLARAMKSPPKYTLLPKSHPLVSKTMQYFESAFQFSEGTNVQALYDLALMHRYVGDLDKALELLEELRHRTRERPNYLTVNAFEQAGWLLLEKSEAERDDQKKKQLAAEAESMFYIALEKAAQLYSKYPQFRGRVGEVLHSFLQLLKDVDESKMSDEEKLVRKAELLLQVSNTRQSMVLIDLIKQQCFFERVRPNNLKMCIEHLLNTEELENALVLTEILVSTPKGSATIAELFADEQYVLRLRVLTARRALLKSNLSGSSEHFHSAFMHTFPLTLAEGFLLEQGGGPLSTGRAAERTSSSNTDPGGEGERETWDVMVVCDRLTAALRDESQHKAEILAGVLKRACGLKVTIMDEAASPGPPYDAMADIMKRSRLILILAGQSQFSGELKLLADQASQRARSTVVTLLAHGDHVPLVLQSFPRAACPAALLDTHLLGTDAATTAARYSQERAEAIYELFRFLVRL